MVNEDTASGKTLLISTSIIASELASSNRADEVVDGDFIAGMDVVGPQHSSSVPHCGMLCSWGRSDSLLPKNAGGTLGWLGNLACCRVQ